MGQMNRENAKGRKRERTAVSHLHAILIRCRFWTVFLVCGSALAAPPDGFVQIRGDQFVYDGRPVRLKGTNYYPRDFMWADLWKAPPGVVLRDAGRMRELGLNCVRILVPYRAGGWHGPTPPPEKLGMLVQMVDLFGQHGIRSVVTLFDWETTFPRAGDARETEHLRHLSAIVARLKDNPYVLMWDVKNEPDHPGNLDGKSDDWKCCPAHRDQILDWLKRMCEAVRQRDPNHPVGVGMRWADNARDTLGFVDVAMFHSYWPNIGDGQIPAIQKALTTPKPIVVEEFGWPTNPTPCDREGKIIHDYTEQRQREMLEMHLKAFERHNIAGGLQWMTFDAAPYTSDPKESFEKYFGLWRADDSLKPGGEVYRDLFKVKPFPVEKASRTR